MAKNRLTRNISSKRNALKGKKGFQKLEVKRTNVVAVRLDDWEIEELDKQCEYYGWSRAEVLRLAFHNLVHDGYPIDSEAETS